MKQVISELARQVRGGTWQLLEATPQAWLTWSPVGTANHILWHAGHAVWLQDVLSIQPLSQRSELPDAWSETFGQHCLPVASRSDWPEVTEIATRLQEQLQRILQLVDAADARRIAADESCSSSGWGLLSGMLHGWHDEARHQGEMYLLWKQRRALG